jgi:hypothetical protein
VDFQPDNRLVIHECPVLKNDISSIATKSVTDKE